jgi:hypothetical protein
LPNHVAGSGSGSVTTKLVAGAITLPSSAITTFSPTALADSRTLSIEPLGTADALYLNVRLCVMPHHTVPCGMLVISMS